MYVRKGVKIDRGNHKEAIRFSGPDAALGAMEFTRIMDGGTCPRTSVSYAIEFGPKRLANGIWHARLGSFVEFGGINTVANIYGTEAEVRHDAEVFIRGYLDADKTTPETNNVKGMQRKIAAQAKEIARLKQANAEICKAANDFQAARREEQKRHAVEVDQIRAARAADSQVINAYINAYSGGGNTGMPSADARFVSLEARVAKLEAATQPSTGPIVVDGRTADKMGLMGMKRHANATGRPVHVLGPSNHHEGRIVEPHK